MSPVGGGGRSTRVKNRKQDKTKAEKKNTQNYTVIQ